MNALEVRFLSDLEIRVHPHPPPGVDPCKCFQLTSPLRVRIGDHELVEIPTAFYSDGGSLPSAVWTLLRCYPTDPECARSFILHDFAYMVGYRGDRKICDDLLYNGCVADGAGWAKRNGIYTGVRLGGWKAWNGHRERSRYTLQKELNGLRPGEPLLRLTVQNWTRNLDGLS